MDALKRKFKEGRQAEAIAECEALCRNDPNDHEARRLCAMMHALLGNYDRALELLHAVRAAKKEEDADVLFNIATCERELKHYENAERYFKIYTARFANHSHGWASAAECQFQLKAFKQGLGLADRAIQLDPSSLAAWTVRGNCQRALGQFENALASFRRANQIQPNVECWLNAGLTLLDIDRVSEAIDSFSRAIELAPNVASLRVARGNALHSRGKLPEAVADFRVALTLAPGDGETLKKACLCLLAMRRGDQAIELCQGILRLQPDMLTATLVHEWVLNELVPTWHVPMMNEQERNKAYHRALESAVTPDKVVFEIGTGSGLLAMMAARLGARTVVTCEGVGLIAETATRIVKRNNFQDRITVLPKLSSAVQLGKDLPVAADILVHEIFASDLLGEHLLDAIEDAKQRLLKPDARVLPSAASIMIALVGGAELGQHLHVEDSFGFDLRDFNAINAKRAPLFRHDLETTLLSDDVEAFRFDFLRDSTFPAEARVIGIEARRSGLCYGVIQWIRIELTDDVRFENHPSQRQAIANWQNIVHRFDAPLYLEAGSVTSVTAAHNRQQPWFDLTAAERTPSKASDG